MIENDSFTTNLPESSNKGVYSNQNPISAMLSYNIRPFSLIRLLLLFSSLCLAGSLSAATIYVDVAAAGANTGADWPNAYTDLQSALTNALAGDEIWVAQGVYIPSVEVDADGSGGADVRERTFQIPVGVTLYGGFAGGEMNLVERDFETQLTILSGDLDMNDANGDGNHIAESVGDIIGNNAYHVVFTQNADANTRLDGFVITAGYAGNIMPFIGSSPNLDGGGWLDLVDLAVSSSSPGIYNCDFHGNYAQDQGGAFYIGSFQPGTFDPVISFSSFSGNEAVVSGGGTLPAGRRSPH